MFLILLKVEGAWWYAQLIAKTLSSLSSIFDFKYWIWKKKHSILYSIWYSIRIIKWAGYLSTFAKFSCAVHTFICSYFRRFCDKLPKLLLNNFIELVNSLVLDVTKNIMNIRIWNIFADLCSNWSLKCIKSVESICKSVRIFTVA